MLIINSDHLMRAGVGNLDEQCPYSGSAYASYPLIMSDDAEQTVYHATCALQLAADLLTDLFTFFHPPAPYTHLFTLTEHPIAPDLEGGSDAIHRSERD